MRGGDVRVGADVKPGETEAGKGARGQMGRVRGAGGEGTAGGERRAGWAVALGAAPAGSVGLQPHSVRSREQRSAFLVPVHGEY